MQGGRTSMPHLDPDGRCEYSDTEHGLHMVVSAQVCGEAGGVDVPGSTTAQVERGDGGEAERARGERAMAPSPPPTSL